jgi:hypothetical protein
MKRVSRRAGPLFYCREIPAWQPDGSRPFRFDERPAHFKLPFRRTISNFDEAVKSQKPDGFEKSSIYGAQISAA